MSTEYFDRVAFDRFVIENSLIKFQKTKLNSGRESEFYVNFREIYRDYTLTDDLSDFVIGFAKQNQLSPNCFIGVPDGATPLAVNTQGRWARMQSLHGQEQYPIAAFRKQPKDHGINGKVYVQPPMRDTILIEDVATEGESLIKYGKILYETQGVNFIGAIVLHDRKQRNADGLSVEEAFRKNFPRSVGYYAMSNALDLLPIAYRNLKPGRDVARRIEEEFDLVGVGPMRL